MQVSQPLGNLVRAGFFAVSAGSTLRDHTDVLGDPCIFEFSEALSSATRPCWNPACEPTCVLLQKCHRSPVFHGKFAGKQISPPQSASLFVPTNIGIHGGIKWARTIDLHDVNAKKRCFGVFYPTYQSPKSEENQGFMPSGDFSCFWRWGASWGSGWGSKIVLFI